MKIEIGGGRNPRPGYQANVDFIEGPGVTHRVDVDRDPLPFADESVDEIYTAHVLEHLVTYGHLLREMVRVARVGANIEIRVPHWLSSMAMCAGHRQTVSERSVRHWCEDYPKDWFSGCSRRLKLSRVEKVRGEGFGRARLLFPNLNDNDLMDFIPDACHEIAFFLEVVANEC